MKFREDINGLRAFAVLGVLIFHFNHAWLPGGFAGVDVFFVISGFLMTSIIFRGLEGNNFSILNFYRSRFRRIVPALLVVVALLAIYGWLFLSPIPYYALSKHGGSSLLFFSNFIYLNESGYFDVASLEKLLLHTWSLSVEWQFYLIYPVVLILLSKVFSINNLKRIIVGLMVFGFAFSVYSSSKWPLHSYFLFPARAWEMLLGGVAYLYPLTIQSRIKKNGLEIVALGLILLSYFTASAETVWPGYYALLPVVGAFLLIQAANNQSIFTSNIIANKLGLWSYSIYLYHWPIVVLNHKYNLGLPFYLYLIITLILSVGSYYLIEKRRWSVKLILVAFALVFIPLTYVYSTKGAVDRVDEKYSLSVKEFHSKYYGGTGYPTFTSSYIGGKNDETYDYLILGDSFARQYALFLDKNKFHTKNWFADGCLLMSEHIQKQHYLNDNGKKCHQLGIDSYKDLSINIKPVLWGFNWDTKILFDKQGLSFNYRDQTEMYLMALEKELDLALNLSQDNVDHYIIGIPTKPSYQIFSCLSETQLLGNKLFKPTCAEFIPRNEPEINQFLKDFAEQRARVYYIDPNEVLCTDKGCRMIIDGEPMFSDMSHLSIYGADLVGKYIFETIDAIESKKMTKNNIND